jgi:3-phosphoshikimate 1-carboxyvinyltransferase
LQISRYPPQTLKEFKSLKVLVPLAIDEFPVLFIAASCADGETVLTGAKELRVKESDRIQVMADGSIH